MGLIVTPALVIRRADYSDYDRMVTLFSPEMGRIDAIARGCRRPKSPLVNAVEPFTSGEFQLYERRDRFTLEQCTISEDYYALRTDYDKLCHGVYWLKLLDQAILPDTPMPRLFITTLRALAHLNWGELPPALVTMAFEMHFMALNGFAPQSTFSTPRRISPIERNSFSTCFPKLTNRCFLLTQFNIQPVFQTLILCT